MKSEVSDYNFLSYPAGPMIADLTLVNKIKRKTEKNIIF